MLEVSDAADVDLEMDREHGSTLMCSSTKKMLAQIEVVTRSLQTRGHTLAKRRVDLDMLIESGTPRKDENWFCTE